MARPFGSKNKRTRNIEDMCGRFKIDPLELLMMVVNADWQGLGFDAPTRISYTNAGIEFEEHNIKLAERVQAAKEAARYLYCQKQSVALSNSEGAIKLVVEDYTNKDKM